MAKDIGIDRYCQRFDLRSGWCNVLNEPSIVG